MNFCLPLPTIDEGYIGPVSALQGVDLGPWLCRVINADKKLVGIAHALIDVQTPMRVHFWHFNKLQVN